MFRPFPGEKLMSSITNCMWICTEEADDIEITAAQASI